jgi:urea transporter
MNLFAIQTYPTAVRIAFYSLFTAWVTFLWSVYQYYGQEFFGRFAIGGVLIVFFMLRLKNWARMLCLCANAMTILYCSLFGLVFTLGETGNPAAVFFSALCVFIFLINSYFLLTKPTREFFKLAGAPEGSASSSSN